MKLQTDEDVPRPRLAPRVLDNDCDDETCTGPEQRPLRLLAPARGAAWTRHATTATELPPVVPAYAGPGRPAPRDPRPDARGAARRT